ncbi:hypothetical protein VST7929_00666 [Vibrio stylophorae]|uniref:Uncharacterized protein n=1 Tax=Vibrio stylophorae TaxID=659351 RepID=A0ABN8DRJ4_9VIBR|nr:hypothetical protein VST7929_00666 [Vibrio stylophorae]
MIDCHHVQSSAALDHQLNFVAFDERIKSSWNIECLN